MVAIPAWEPTEHMTAAGATITGTLTGYWEQGWEGRILWALEQSRAWLPTAPPLRATGRRVRTARAPT